MSISEDAGRPDRRGDAGFYAVAVVVGAITGLLGSILHLGTDQLLGWPAALKSHTGIAGLPLLIAAGAIAAAMVLLSVWLVRRFAPERA